MRRLTRAIEKDAGLWYVYRHSPGNAPDQLLGVIYDRGAKIQEIRNEGYDIFDSWDMAGAPGKKLGEARRFPSAMAFLNKRYFFAQRGIQWPPPDPLPPNEVTLNINNALSSTTPETRRRNNAIEMQHMRPPPQPASAEANAAYMIRRIDAAAKKGSVENPKPKIAEFPPKAFEPFKPSRRPVKTYRVADSAAHVDSCHFLLDNYGVPALGVLIAEGEPMRNERGVVRSTLDSWWKENLVYRGISPDRQDDQWIWKFDNNLGVSVLVRFRVDVIYAAMLKFADEATKDQYAKHPGCGLHFKPVAISGWDRDDYTDYWNDLEGSGSLHHFIARVHDFSPNQWEPDPHWEEQNRRIIGAPLVQAAFSGIIKGGPYWLPGYNCWLASCYNIRYPSDLKGFIPVAAYSMLDATRDRSHSVCRQWLILAKDGKVFVDARSGGDRDQPWGVSPKPVEDLTYPSAVFDWIFGQIIPQLNHEQQASKPSVSG